MNFEELLDIKSMDDMKDAIIEREIRVANKGGPDDFRRYIKNRIGFDISGEDWEELCECFQRRNLLVHNDLYPDRKYLAEVATSKKGERLIVDHKYLNEGFDLFERYAESITQQFHAQYCGDISFTKGSMKLQISPEELQSLIMKFVDTGHLPSSGM